MSGECYSAKDARRMDSLQVKDYEAKVLTAEKKCSTLKQQLEQMKSFYNQSTATARNSTRQTFGSSAKFSCARIRSFVDDAGERKSEQTVGLSQKTCRYSAPSNQLTRQNSQKISTDHSGGVLGTINTMMAGITESIRDQPGGELRPTIKSIQGVENIKINSKASKDQKTSNEALASSKKRVGGNKFKLRSKKSTSSHRLLKKSRKSALKVSDSNKMNGDGGQGNLYPSRTQSRSQYQMANFENIKSVSTKKKCIGPTKKALNQFQADSMVSKRKTPLALLNKSINKNLKDGKGHHERRPKDLVEIYHNIAVKDSHSSEFNETKNKPAKKEPPNILDLVPPLAIRTEHRRCAGIQSATKFELSTVSKNYEMPTISSRMKQVAKYYMTSFNFSKNFRSIPFCTVTSTSPSHNIGLNIQQVMNMVKTRQPSQKLPPTLAYNIGLAAEKWTSSNGGGLSFLISNMTSRANSQCPLSKSVMNYQQLQEAAKTIPEEAIDEEDEPKDTELLKSPEMQSMFITGPSGDVKVTNRKATVWSADPNNSKKCSCAPQKGVELNQVVSKIASATNQAQMGGTKRPASISMKRKSSNFPAASNKTLVGKTTPLQGKEQKLKMVLNKLHDEFASMNNKYEDLLEKNNADDGNGVNKDDTLKQLQVLDKELSQKEEEIVMVMTLFKEVLALKQQVKSLKERSNSSKEALSVKSQASRLNGYNRTTTAGVLNKLLRQVQHFSSHYNKTTN